MDIIIDADCDCIPQEAEPLVSQGGAILNFLVCLGYDPVYPPCAEVLKRIHHLEGSWLIASPVQWQATHNDAVIVAADQTLLLSETESKYWFALYSEYLAAEDVRLYYHDAKTWLLHAENKPSLHAKSVHQLMNLSLMPELAQLDSTLYWQKFLTECQMFFASRVNSSELNGIWLWGGGSLTDKEKHIYADIPFVSVVDKATLYSNSVVLNSYSILLLSNSDVLSEPHGEQLKKIPVCWYWNNAAYRTNPQHWFTRFWRNLIHAN